MRGAGDKASQSDPDWIPQRQAVIDLGLHELPQQQ